MDRTHAFPGNRVVCLKPPNKGQLATIFGVCFPPGIIYARLPSEEISRGEVVEGDLEDFKPYIEALSPKNNPLNGS